MNLVIKQLDILEVGRLFDAFIQDFLSEEEGTTKTKMLGGFWTVENKKHNFFATISCEYRINDLERNTKDWYAVVNNGTIERKYIIGRDEVSAKECDE